MPKRKDNADPVFKVDIGEEVKRDKYVNPKKVFDYKKLLTDLLIIGITIWSQNALVSFLFFIYDFIMTQLFSYQEFDAFLEELSETRPMFTPKEKRQFQNFKECLFRFFLSVFCLWFKYLHLILTILISYQYILMSIENRVWIRRDNKLLFSE